MVCSYELSTRLSDLGSANKEVDSVVMKIDGASFLRMMPHHKERTDIDPIVKLVGALQSREQQALTSYNSSFQNTKRT